MEVSHLVFAKITTVHWRWYIEIWFEKKCIFAATVTKEELFIFLDLQFQYLVAVFSEMVVLTAAQHLANPKVKRQKIRTKRKQF